MGASHPSFPNLLALPPADVGKMSARVRAPLRHPAPPPFPWGYKWRRGAEDFVIRGDLKRFERFEGKRFDDLDLSLRRGAERRTKKERR